MTIIGYFYIFIFYPFFLPLFIIVIIGKPLFLLKLISKIIHFQEPIKKTEIFNILLSVLSLFSIYFFIIVWNNSSNLENLLKKEKESSDYFELEMNKLFNDERNLYLFLTCIAILFTVSKVTERMIRINEHQQQLTKLKSDLAKSGIKTDEAKKKD